MGRTHYADFDVLNEQGAWDAFTRSLVRQRLNPPAPSTLTEAETRTLRAAVRHLVCEDGQDVLDFVIAHFDTRVRSTAGEGQRKVGLPAEAALVRQGLLAIDALARVRHGTGFAECDEQQQFRMLSALQNGENTEMAGIPQQELFKKLLGIAVDACASHPAVWSEMGYAGPAYPRGYYRLDRGIRDPWEPAFAPRHGGTSPKDGRADGDDRHDR